jgi:hypothetical protein
MMCIEIDYPAGVQDNQLKRELLLLMSVFSKTLLTLVRCHFVLLSFLTAWHSSFLICISNCRRRVKQLFQILQIRISCRMNGRICIK